MTDEELIARLRGRSQFCKDRGEVKSPDLMDEAADRIEALTEQLTAARADAKETEAYAGKLESDRRKTYEALLLMSRLHSDVEAKLARAEWLLTDAMVQLEEGKIKTRRNRARLIREFLSETIGEPK